MENTLKLYEEIKRIKFLLDEGSVYNNDMQVITEQWKPLGDFAQSVIKRAKLVGKYVAKTIDSADDVLPHFKLYKSLWKAINPAYKVDTIENLIDVIISGKNNPFELVNGTPLYRSIPNEGNLRYNVIQAWRIKNNITDEQYKKFLASVSSSEKKSIPDVKTVTPKVEPKVIDPKTAPEGTEWKNTITIDINGKKQIITGDKFIKNSDGTISKYDVNGKEVDRIDITKLENESKIINEPIDEFTQEVLNDLDEVADDIVDDGNQITMSKKDRKFLLRYVVPDSGFFNKFYNLLRSFGGFKSPDTYLEQVKKQINDFYENTFSSYVDKNLSSLETMSPADIQKFNTDLRNLILNFDLSRKNTETFDNLWLEIKDEFLKSVDEIKIPTSITDKNQISKIKIKRKNLANKIIQMCEKGVDGKEGTFNSISKFLEVMRPTTNDYSLFPSGVEKSAWYDLGSLKKWSGLDDELKNIKNTYKNSADKGNYIMGVLKLIWIPFKRIGERLISYLIMEAPVRFTKLVPQLQNVFRQGITAKKFGKIPEYLYEAVVTYIKWMFSKLLMLPLINAVNSTIEYFKYTIGMEIDPRYSSYNPVEEFCRGYMPLFEEKGEWKKLFVTFGVGPLIEGTIDLGYFLKNSDSPDELVKKEEESLQQKLERLGLESDEIEEVKNIDTRIDRAKKIKEILLKRVESYNKLLEDYDIEMISKRFPQRMVYLKDSIQEKYGDVKGKMIFGSIKKYFLFTDDTQIPCIAYTNNLKKLSLYVSKEGIYAIDDTGKRYGESELYSFGDYVYKNKNKLLTIKSITEKIKASNSKIAEQDKELTTESISPIINKLIKEMEEGKKFGEDNFKHWKDTFKFKKYDEKTGQLKDVKITTKMDEIMDRIDHFRKKYDEDDSFVRAVIDVFGTGIDVIQYTKGLAHLTEGVIVEGLMGVLANIRESKELVTWTVKHYNDGNWELVKGNFNKKELLNVGKTKRERDERQKESDNPAEGLKKKEQESIMILNRDEKEGLNGLPTKIKEKVKEKLRQGWTTEKPFDFLDTYYTESEINSVFNDKIKIYKLKPSAEFFRSLAKNSSKITVKKGFCKSVKNAKGEYDLSEKEKNTLNHFISKCETKFGV